MAEATIKELAIELTVEATTICDRIQGRSIFINQLLRCCSSIGATAMRLSMPIAVLISSASWRSP